MDINLTHNGIGDNIAGNKIIINPKDPPIVLESRFISTENYLNGYKTKFVVVVGNVSQSITVNVKTFVDSEINFIEKMILQSTGTRNNPSGQIPYKSFLVSLFTNKKMSSNDFIFSVNLKL